MIQFSFNHIEKIPYLRDRKRILKLYNYYHGKTTDWYLSENEDNIYGNYLLHLLNVIDRAVGGCALTRKDMTFLNMLYFTMQRNERENKS